jgi:hypothetical protein
MTAMGTIGGLYEGERGPAQDTGRGDMIVVPKYPIGTDPKAMDRLIEDEIAKRGYIPDPQRHRGQVQAKDRGKIFNRALLKAVKPPEAKEVEAAMTTENGDTLEIVGDNEVPEILNEDRRGRGDE